MTKNHVKPCNSQRTIKRSASTSTTPKLDQQRNSSSGVNPKLVGVLSTIQKFQLQKKELTEQIQNFKH